MNRETQIPLFRGKKIDSDEYIEGFLQEHNHIETKEKTYYIGGWGWACVEVDPSTLAIHFPDMIASDSDRLLPNGEKDLRIFASLSEDGKGGDIINDNHFDYVLVFCRSNFHFKDIDLKYPMIYGSIDDYKGWGCFKIKGIQQ